MAILGRHMGAAIQQAGQSAGNSMMQYASSQAALEERARERMEQLRYQNAARQDQILLAAAVRGGGEGGRSSLSPEDQNALIANTAKDKDGNLMFSSGAEVGKVRDASRTGDYSGFMETNEYDVPDENGNVEKVKVAGYPPGFEKQLQAKRAALGEISESYALGKDYKPVMEGRENGQKMGMIDQAVRDPKKAGDLAQAQAVGKGQGAYKTTDGVTTNEFTGNTKVTAVGQSKIDKNERPPPSADPTKIDLQSLETNRKLLTSQREGLQREMKMKLENGTPRKDVDAQYGPRLASLDQQLDELGVRIKNFGTGNRDKTPVANPAPLGNKGKAQSGAAKNYSSLWK